MEFTNILVMFKLTFLFADFGFCVELTNIALGKYTYQKTTEYSDAGGSELAVDGNTNQYWSGGSCAHTGNNVFGNYWEVDLGDTYVIDSVTIYNRMDSCCSDKLVGVQIYFGFSRDSYSLTGYNNGTILTTHTFQMNQAVYGRWVKVTRFPDTNSEMMLCEVEVLGYIPSTVMFRRVTDASGTGASLGIVYTLNWPQCCYACFKTAGCGAVKLSGSTCTLLDSDGFDYSAGDTLYKLN